MRNTVPKVAVFLCALFLLTTGHVSALSSKQLALTEDPFHYRETALKQVQETKEKQEAKEQEETKKAEAEKKEREAEKPIEKPVINHTVAPGESLAKIAATYNTTWDRLYAKNTQIAQPDIINVNDTIIIPETDEVLPQRALPVVEQIASSSSGGTTTKKVARVSAQPRGSSSGNTYTPGYCTWYAKSRRPDLPNRMGNASAWVSSAAAQGFATGSTPRAGAIGQQGNHVVYVESVNGDGTITISEMNYRGLYVISSRTAAASSFRYIY
jgi:surface antigen